MRFCSVGRQGFGHKETAQLGPWYTTGGGVRKPAGRQCGFRHHLALSSIEYLFPFVKVEFCGLMPLAYFHHRARAGSRPPPVAALALALTLPGNGGRASIEGQAISDGARPRGGPAGRPTPARVALDARPQAAARAGGQQGPPTPTRRRATRPGEGGGDEPGGPTGRRQGGPQAPAARAKAQGPPPPTTPPARGEFQWSRLPLWVGRDAPGRGDQPPSEGPGSRPSRAGGPGGELTHCRGPEIPTHRFAEIFVR